MSKTKEPVLKVSTDYDKFKILDYNRGLNEGLIKRLMKSIQEIGYIAGKPVIVDKEMHVIDGQHRLQACKRLGLPVYYTVETADVQKTMMHLNAQQTNWSTQNYIDSYATKGIKCYELLQKFEDQFKLGISNSLEIFFLNDRKQLMPSIKEGKPFKTRSDAYDIARFVLKCESVPYYRSAFFVRAVVRTYSLMDDKQREKLLGGIMGLPQQATTAAYITAFENLINRGVMSKNRISLNKA